MANRTPARRAPEPIQSSTGGPCARNGGASAARGRDAKNRKACWSRAGGSKASGTCAAQAVSAASASQVADLSEGLLPRWTRPPASECCNGCSSAACQPASSATTRKTRARRASTSLRLDGVGDAVEDARRIVLQHRELAAHDDRVEAVFHGLLGLHLDERLRTAGHAERAGHRQRRKHEMGLLVADLQRHHEALHLDFLLVERRDALRELRNVAVLHLHDLDLREGLPRHHVLALHERLDLAGIHPGRRLMLSQGRTGERRCEQEKRGFHWQGSGLGTGLTVFADSGAFATPPPGTFAHPCASVPE